MRERWLTDWIPSERWPHYTRANSGEVLPNPATPLSVTYAWDNGICQGWRDGYIRSGNYAADEWDDAHPEVCGFFGGYLYINLANVRMQGVRNPAVTVEQLDMAFFGEHPDVPPYTPHPADERADLLPRINKHLEWLLTTTAWPEIDDEKAATRALRAARPELAELSDAQLLARAREIQPLLAKLFDSHTITSSGSGVAPGILFAVGAAIGDETIPMKLVAAMGEVDSADASLHVWLLSRQIRASAELCAAFDAGAAGAIERLASSATEEATAFVAAWRAFLAEFGARGPNELEISADTWETDPALALAALDRVRLQSDDEDPSLRHQRRLAEREQITAEVRAKLAALGTGDIAGQFEAALVAAHQMAFRERTKTNLIRALHEARMVFRELGRRHAIAGHLADPSHIFQLLDSELEAFVAEPSKFRDELAGRAEEFAELADLEPPFIIRDAKVPPLTEWSHRSAAASTRPTKPGDTIEGVAGSPGIARGRARVILDVAYPGDLEPGDILVAPLTDAGWTPLFLSAGGVVVDVGGQISHAVIVSRELGLPCVVSATNATTQIPDGALIEVDGDHGRVTVLESP